MAKLSPQSLFGAGIQKSYEAAALGLRSRALEDFSLVGRQRNHGRKIDEHFAVGDDLRNSPARFSLFQRAKTVDGNRIKGRPDLET